MIKVLLQELHIHTCISKILAVFQNYVNILKYYGT